jgi:RNA polymerase primary sigma factor
VLRLAALDQQVYAAIAWENCPAEPERLAAALRGRCETEPDPAAIRQAILRVADLARRDPSGPSGRTETVSLDATAEDGGGHAIADTGLTAEEQMILAEEEQARGAMVAAVQAAAAGLGADERLYLQIVFSATDPLPSREIAKLMGRAVGDVYRLRQWAQRWMTEIASQLEKKSNPSV